MFISGKVSIDKIFNCVNYNIEDMDNLYRKVCKYRLYCSDPYMFQCKYDDF